MEELRIPDSEMILGVSACALQTEGNDTRNTWYEWYKKGYIKDGASPNDACGFYDNYAKAVDMMAEMGIRRFRLGVEWSRIEPARGVFNNGVIKHYREMLEYIISRGIEPMLTLHSFADPVWFMDLGGFESDGCVDIFLHYVKKAAESFGDLVSDFITINEPNTYAINGYFYGCFPPGKQSFKSCRTVLTNLAKCHMSAYGLIHSVMEQMGRKNARVSCSIATIYHEPKDPASSYQRRAARWLDRFGYMAFAEAILKGTARRPMRKLGLPAGCYADFIAMNYQYGTMVTGFEERRAPQGFPVSDLGNPICPEGIVKCARDLASLKDLPVCVTENGVCDSDDLFRIKYIYEHLRAMIESSVFFEGYYYRSFTDSFEFLDGNSARFGLVYTDFSTGEMSVKRSGEFYSDIIKNDGVTEEMTLRYAGTYYHDIDGNILEGIDEVYTDREKFLKSENGTGVITSVSEYARDPENYDERLVREPLGLNARTSVPDDETLKPLGSGSAQDALSAQTPESGEEPQEPTDEQIPENADGVVKSPEESASTPEGGEEERLLGDDEELSAPQPDEAREELSDETGEERPAEDGTHTLEEPLPGPDGESAPEENCGEMPDQSGEDDAPAVHEEEQTGDMPDAGEESLSEETPDAASDAQDEDVGSQTGSGSPEQEQDDPEESGTAALDRILGR